MDHFQFIYTHRAAEYHHMISAEDADGRLLAAIQARISPAGKRILDLGSGTGRIPLLLGGLPAQLAAIDISWAMLDQNRLERERFGGHWELAQGDLRRLPFPNAWADLTIAGWAIGHLRAWHANDWQAHIGAAIDELLRVTTRHGWAVILETLGTGGLGPAPPSPELAEYYTWLEDTWDFSCQEIPTDYVFASVEAAVAATEFFFGAELAGQIRRNGWSRLPEWTGMWSK